MHLFHPRRTLFLSPLVVLALALLSTELFGQSAGWYVETDLSRLRNGLTPVMRDAVATPDGGYLILYSSENMSREFAERYRGPTLPTIGLMKVTSDGEVEWSRFVDDLRELTPSLLLIDDDLNYLVGGTLALPDRGPGEKRTALFRVGPLGSLIDAWLLPEEVSGSLIDGLVLENEVVLLVVDDTTATLVRGSYPVPDQIEAFRIADGAGGRFYPESIARDSAGRDIVAGHLRTSDERRPVEGGVMVLDSLGVVLGGGNLQGEGLTTLEDIVVLPDQSTILVGTSGEPPGSTTEPVDTMEQGFSRTSQTFPILLQLDDQFSVDTTLRILHNRFHLIGKSLGLREDGSLIMLGVERSTAGDAGSQSRFSSGGGVVIFDHELDTVETVPVGRLRGPDDDDIEGDPFSTIEETGMVGPTGYPRIAASAPGALNSFLLVGNDIRGVPVLLHHSPYREVPCMQSSELQTQIVATGDRLRPRSFTATAIRTSGVDYITPALADDSLRLISPCPIQSGGESDPGPAMFDLIMTPNTIRQGENLEVEVHIDVQEIGSFEIEVVDPKSGEREILVNREAASPYHETITLPTSDLPPGPYIAVLRAEELERIVRFRVEP